MTKLISHLSRPAHLPGLLWKNLRQPFTVAAAEQRFDRRLGGIDTGGFVPGEQLDIPGATAYHACPPRIVERLLREIADPRLYAFVDIGAGKGRALLIAAKYPFVRVIGVELNGPLASIATRNVEVARCHASFLAPIEIAKADAVNYAWPETPCVFFLYRPFTGELAEQVMQSVIRSFRSKPRRMIILYYTQEYPLALQDAIFVRHDIPDLPNDRLDRFRNFGFSAAVFEAVP